MLGSLKLTKDSSKSQDWLRTENLKSNLRGRTVRGGFSSFLGGNISFALRTISGIVLARLLMPSDYGIISMITAVTVFADSFKDMGLDAATIQKTDVTHEQVSTLFWINAGVGASLTLLVCALSPALAWFYKDPRLIPVTLAISLNYLLGGVAIQHQALLRRQMLFAKLASVQVISIVLGIVVAIAFALAGAQYWALVANQVSQSLFYAIGIYFFCPWLPGRPQKGTDVRSMLRFGRDVTASNLVYFISTSLNQMLMGKIWGAASLGLYSQAYKLVIIPREQTRVPLESIAISALSALQADSKRYQVYCRKITEMYAFVNIALSAYFVIFSEALVHAFLGPKWIGSIPLFRVFSITTLVGCLTFPVMFIMYTKGKTKQLARYAFGQTGLNVIGVVIGIRWGALGVAIGLLVSNYLYAIPGLWYAIKDTEIKMSLVFRAVSMSALGTGVMSAGLLLFREFFPQVNVFLYVLCSLVLAVTLYGGFWLIAPGGKDKLETYVSYLADLVRRKKPAAQDE
jgi:O-antigen/teichoic acid export membrane protein